MNAEPQQITPLSPFAGAMVETFFFGFCIAFAMMILFSTRRYVIRVLFVYFVCLLGLQLGLDMYSAWKIEHRDQADVVAGFGEIAIIEEPIGIRTLCALTASVIVPVHAFYLVLMMRFNVPMILFIATALFGFIGFLTGIASSVSRTSQNDPGWATNDNGNAFALQCAFYATIFLTDFLTSIALLRAWVKDRKVKGVQIFHHLATLPFVPCIMTAALVCVTGLCKDRSVQLAILMPSGSVHVSTLALYLVNKGSQDHSNEHRNPTNPEKEAMKPAIRILVKPKPALNRAHSQKGAVKITRETCIDSKQIKEPVDHQKKTKERVLLESSTPNFLRTDPYTLGKRSMSMASLSRPVTREETLYEQSNSSKYSIAQYKENKVSSSRPASVHSKSIRKRQETEEKERFVKVDFSQSSSPSSRGSSSHGHKKRHQSSPEEENQILETHIICELLTTSPAHSSTSSSSKTSMHLDGTAY